MKSIYLLFVVLTDTQGYEKMRPVTNIKHHSMLECKVEKAQHKNIEGVNGINGINRIQFFCGDETKYFNKEQKLY
jgi:hypothetical protein